jgi:hypothetical protein
MKTYLSGIAFALTSSLLLAACGGGGGGSRSAPTPPTPKPGSIQFETPTLTASEVATGTTVSVNVTRTGGSEGAVSVTIDRAGTATAGADYTLASTAVAFADGDAATKTVRVIVNDDADFEPDETLVLTLTGSAAIGTPASTTLTIKDNDPPAAPTLSAVTAGIKQLTFSWSSVAGATSYRLVGKPDAAAAEFEPLDLEVAAPLTSLVIDIAAHGLDWVSPLYAVEACIEAACSAPSNPVSLLPAMLNSIGYVKASNTQARDNFGIAVALSRDGNTLAVGALLEDSTDDGVNGDQAADTNGADFDSGAVYVFARDTRGQWSQQAYLKASNPDKGDGFGRSLALSADGNTLAVGATHEDSDADVVNGDQGNGNLNFNAGAVYVFARNDRAEWSQHSYVKASNSGQEDVFGTSLALSEDGRTLAVGATGDDSDATTINGDQGNGISVNSGAVYVFTLGKQSTWSQQAYVKPPNTDRSDQFGSSVALSEEGDTLAVGAVEEDSAAEGIDGELGNISPDFNSGAVYVFTRDALGTWSKQAYLKASNTGKGDLFGSALTLSSDGNTLAVAATDEDSLATVVDGDDGDDPANGINTNAGAVYVFARDAESAWSQQAYVKASNSGPTDFFGISLALSADGSTLAIGAHGEDSGATGIDGDQGDIGPGFNAGAVYVFVRDDDDASWSQETFVKSSNIGQLDAFGSAVALSGDGETLVVASNGEDSNATGISHDATGRDQTNNDAQTSGAVYLY